MQTETSQNPQVETQPSVEKSPLEIAFEQIESLDFDDNGEFVVTGKPPSDPPSGQTESQPSTEQPVETKEETVSIERFKGMQADATRKANEINELKAQNQALQVQMTQFLQAMQSQQMAAANPNQQMPIDAADIFSDINKAVPFIAEVIKEVNKRTTSEEIKSLGMKLDKISPDVAFINKAVEANKLAETNADFKDKIPAMKSLIKEYAEMGKDLSIPEAYQQIKIAEKVLGAGVPREAISKGSASAPSGITPTEVQSRINATKTVRGSASPSVTPKVEIKSPKDAILAAIAGSFE